MLEEIRSMLDVDGVYPHLKETKQNKNHPGFQTIDVLCKGTLSIETIDLEHLSCRNFPQFLLKFRKHLSTMWNVTPSPAGVYSCFKITVNPIRRPFSLKDIRCWNGDSAVSHTHVSLTQAYREHQDSCCISASQGANPDVHCFGVRSGPVQSCASLGSADTMQTRYCIKLLSQSLIFFTLNFHVILLEGFKQHCHLAM